MGCPYSGVSIPGPCSTEPGILSLREIEVLVQREGLRVEWVGGDAAGNGGSATGTKELLFGGGKFWMGFDDEESWEVKRGWADGLCIGGTVVWSWDLVGVGR